MRFLSAAIVCCILTDAAMAQSGYCARCNGGMPQIGYAQTWNDFSNFVTAEPTPAATPTTSRSTYCDQIFKGNELTRASVNAKKQVEFAFADGASIKVHRTDDGVFHCCPKTTDTGEHYDLCYRSHGNKIYFVIRTFEKEYFYVSDAKALRQEGDAYQLVVNNTTKPGVVTFDKNGKITGVSFS